MKNRLKPLAILSILCLGCIIYSDSLFCSFHFDDYLFIIYNPVIKNIYDLQAIWHYFHGRFITFLSLALNYHLHGFNVLGYHLFNLAVHVISAILVWWLTLLTFSTPALKEDKITRHRETIALLSGLVFVSHPLQVEAVTYIWQRAASMAAMFYLASFCFYVKSRLCFMDSLSRGNDKNNNGRIDRHSQLLVIPAKAGIQIRINFVGIGEFYYFASWLTAVMAMFTKENTVTLPLMVLFYEYVFLRTKEGIDWRRIGPFLLTLFIIPITFLFLKSQLFQSMHGELRISGGTITPMSYVLTQVRAMFTYMRLAFIPIHQNIDYDYPVLKSFIELPFVISGFFLLTIFYLAGCLFSRYKLIAFSIFWFLLTLAVPESIWTMGDIIFEHRLYLPLAGYSIFLVSGLYYLCGGKNIRIMVILLTLYLAFNSILTYQRNKVWRDDITLWADAISKSPHKARPYFNRSNAYQLKGDWKDAKIDYQKAITIDPSYAFNYLNDGVFFESQGDLKSAILEYTKLINVDPGNAAAYYKRGKDYLKENDYNNAIVDYSKAVNIDPKLALAYYERAISYLNQRRLDKALVDFTRASSLNPDLVEIHYYLALLYYFKADYTKAWFSVHRAISAGCKIDPHFLRDLKQASGS